MILSDCPLTRELNNYWNRKLHIYFPILDKTPNVMCLSLKEYLTNIPQKLYDIRTYEDYYSYLISLKTQFPNLLINFLKEHAHELNIAIETLNVINSLDVHDCKIDLHNQIEAIRYIENNIHYNYQQITESVLHKFILLIAIDKRISRNKPIDGLDIYNCIEELKLSSFNFVANCYNNVIRNGIAHGDFSYTCQGIVYKGKKGATYTTNEREIISLFDRTMDFCNGFALAFKLFLITNQDFFDENNLSLPKSFLIQELKSQVNAPRWEIIDCLENYTIDNKKQLNIFTKNSLFDITSVNYFAFRTVVFAEYFAPKYDRYFISLESKYSLPGWAAYSGEILRNGRKTNSLEEYQNVLEDGLLFFVPKIRFPKFIISILNFYTIIKNNWSFIFLLNKGNIIKRNFTIRDTVIHRRNTFLIINDARVYISPDCSDDIESVVRQNYKNIVKYTIKQSKKEFNRFSCKQLLRVKSLRLCLYESDMRKRNYQSAGLIDNLICTISINKSRRIKEIDIIGGTPEQFGIYRIVWNKAWLQKVKHKTFE